MTELGQITPESPAALINRELSWLSFARRVLTLAEDPGQPLLERVKFAGIMGMIYDEFAMKRTGGRRGVASLCIGGGEAVAMAIETFDMTPDS